MNNIELKYGVPTLIDGETHYLISIEKLVDASAEVDSVLTLKFVKTWDDKPIEMGSHEILWPY